MVKAISRFICTRSLAAPREIAKPFVLTLALIGASYWVLARSCAYDHLAIFKYLGYLSIFVWLPGAVALRSLQRESVPLAQLVAIGLPIGFALEILVFFGLSALHLRGLYIWTPFLWVLAGYALSIKREAFLLMGSGRIAGQPWIVCALAALVLAVMLTAASQLFAPAPLFNGQLVHVTHHDWVYLLSRAAEIKQRWPLQDPSLAGAPLSYHYFLMVHVAASSLVTGDELSVIMLRFIVLPLGAVLIAQAFWLGRSLSRHAWGGVLAVVLLLISDEVSFEASTDSSTFLNLFIRWLYLSPTFFFGMIFMGALVVWLYRMVLSSECTGGDLAILFLLSAAATGAKGTVVPPLIVALAIWIGWEILETRRLPKRKLVLLLAMAGGFGTIYFSVLLDWGTGSAEFVPFAALRLARFWVDHASRWQRGLEELGLSSLSSVVLADLSCAAIMMLGFHGVRILGLLYWFRPNRHANPSLARWLGLVYVAYLVFGHMLSLDCYSQLYLLFPVKMPLAALGAAALFDLLPGMKRRLQAYALLGPSYFPLLAIPVLGVIVAVLIWKDEISCWGGIFAFIFGLFCLPLPVGRGGIASILREPRQFCGFLGRVSPYLALLAVALVQINHWALRNRQGLQLWAVSSCASQDKDMALLNEGMSWIRTSTRADAIIVANAFTTRNMEEENVANIDRTTVDKYYYYSALAERRFWVEGPTYLKNQKEAKRRMEVADKIFHEGRPEFLLPPGEGPYYLVVDHRLNDGAQANLPDKCRMFANDRLAVYRVPRQFGLTVASHP